MMKNVVKLNVPEYMMFNPHNYPKPGLYEVRGKYYNVTMVSVTEVGEVEKPGKVIPLPTPEGQSAIDDFIGYSIADKCFNQLMLNVLLATAVALLALGYAA